MKNTKGWETALGIMGMTTAWLLVQAGLLPAAIVFTGDVDPPDPYQWHDGTNAYVGKTGEGSASVTQGSILRCEGAHLGLESGAQGTVTVNGAGSKWFSHTTLYIGEGGSGNLIVENGGEVVSTVASVALSRASHGNVVVRGPDSRLALARTISVGSIGNGTLRIENGAQVSCHGASIGLNSGSRGSVTVSGGAKWLNSWFLKVGPYGTGTLTVSDGALVTAETLHTSLDDLLGDGRIEVHGLVLDGDMVFDAAHGPVHDMPFGSGGVLHLDIDGSSDLGAGYRGQGTLLITDGVSLSSWWSWLGELPGSSGTAVVRGPGSQWNMSVLYVGSEGEGTLRIEDGALVNSESASIAADMGSKGTAIVSGPGSKWQAQRSLSIGYCGDGIIVVKNGGEVRCGQAYVGDDSAYGYEENNLVRITGPGSKFVSQGIFSVGDNNHGALLVEDGAEVISQSGYLAYWRETSGRATINGPGSKWTIAQELQVGRLDTARLAILGGGKVTAASAGVNDLSCLMVDVGPGSLLDVGSGSGTLSNDGTVRILAGLGAQGGSVHQPIRAGAWMGTGTYQAIGGTWDAERHEFTVSPYQPAPSWTHVDLDLSQCQRVLIEDEGTCWILGASFPASETSRPIVFFAEPVTGDLLYELEYELPPGHELFGAWQLSVEGFTPSAEEPVYLSFGVFDFETGRGGLNASEITLWHYDGTKWSPLESDMFTHDGQYANFLAESFSAYAVSAVPEPGTLLLAVGAAFAGVVWQWWRGRRA